MASVELSLTLQPSLDDVKRLCVVRLTETCHGVMGSWVTTYLQGFQWHKPLDGEAINYVLFCRCALLILSAWGSGPRWRGIPVALPLWFRGEVTYRALYMTVSYPIWSPLLIPHWPRLPLLTESTGSRPIYVLHQEALDKAWSYREWTFSWVRQRQYSTSIHVKSPEQNLLNIQEKRIDAVDPK